MVCDWSSSRRIDFLWNVQICIEDSTKTEVYCEIIHDPPSELAPIIEPDYRTPNFVPPIEYVNIPPIDMGKQNIIRNAMHLFMNMCSTKCVTFQHAFLQFLKENRWIIDEKWVVAVPEKGHADNNGPLKCLICPHFFNRPEPSYPNRDAFKRHFCNHCEVYFRMLFANFLQ